LKKERIRTLGIERVEAVKLAVNVAGRGQYQRFEEMLDEEFPDLRIADRSDTDGVLEITLDIPDKETDHIRKLAVDQALETIRNRIDQFGVSEPDIRIQGERRILIQLPGIKDTQRAKDLIGKTALLEFKLVDENTMWTPPLDGNVPASSEDPLRDQRGSTTRRVQKIPYLVKKRTCSPVPT
jgi:preprotein translocase subunit SecD